MHFRRNLTRYGSCCKELSLRLKTKSRTAMNNTSISSQIRDARIDDARAIATVHVDSWRSGYRGIVPDDFLDALSVDRRMEFWRKVMASATDRSVLLVACDAVGSIIGFASGGAERTGNL